MIGAVNKLCNTSEDGIRPYPYPLLTVSIWNVGFYQKYEALNFAKMS